MGIGIHHTLERPKLTAYIIGPSSRVDYELTIGLTIASPYLFDFQKRIKQ
jgi:hypothetical protein